jgi:hypothetical protein
MPDSLVMALVTAGKTDLAFGYAVFAFRCARASGRSS